MTQGGNNSDPTKLTKTQCQGHESVGDCDSTDEWMVGYMKQQCAGRWPDVCPNLEPESELDRKRYWCNFVVDNYTNMGLDCAHPGIRIYCTGTGVCDSYTG